MFSKLASILTLSIGLGGCFELPLSSSGKIEQSSSAGLTEQALSTNVGSTKAIATIDSNSQMATQLTTPQVSGLSGASVVIAPGSLSISIDIVVEQAADFGETSMTSEMGLADDIQVVSASSGMIIRPSENADLKKPLSLAMPLPSGVGLRLANVSSKYAIFYKYFDPTEARLVTGFKVVDGVNVKMSFDEKSGRDIIQFEGYFGAYWATTLSREVKVSEVPPAKAAEEPIVNKANVSVIETKGIVKESEIVQKQAVPELVWTKPSIKFNASTRSVSVAVSPPSGRSVTGCKIDLYESATKPSGITLEAPLGTSIEYTVVKASEHSLLGRFRCLDDQGRTSVTPWSDAVVIPALAPSTAVAGPCSVPQVPMEGRKYNAPSSENLPFNALGQCRYSANLFMDTTDSFYLARSDSSMVCGLATHNLIEGVQTIKCQKATAANIGGDFLTIARGNYSIVVDFSASQSEPQVTITRVPCALGDMHILFNDTYNTSGTPPAFPAPGAASKMTHIGACEFVYDSPSPPTTSIYGKMTIVNGAQTVYCGDTDFLAPSSPPPMEMGDREYVNSCSSAPKFFKMPSPEAGVSSYHFSVRLGASAQEHSNNASNIVRFERISHCPSVMYLYSNASGQTPRRDFNEAYKMGACRYEFFYAADSSAPDLAFKIGDETKTKLCGSISSAPNDIVDVSCDSSASAITPATIVPGHIYRVSVDGDGATGAITNISMSEVSGTERSCDGGLYSSSSIVNGFYNAAANGFVETRECLFERVWTPTVANDGFYLHSGRQQKFCGSSNSPDNQPSIGGAETKFYCRGNYNEAADISPIRPLNAVAGTSYKIVADLRFPAQARVKVQPYAPQNCADDVYINGSGYIPASVKMTPRGDCSYVYDLTLPSGGGGSIDYNFSLGGSSCGLGSSAPSTSFVDRSASLNCSSSDNLSLNNIYGDHTYRWFLKRDPASLNAIITVQDITRDTSTLIFSGAAGTALSKPMFQSAVIAGPPSNSLAYDWTVGTANTFLLERNLGMPSYCGLAATSPLPVFGTPVNMICNIGSTAMANARVFQNAWTPGQTLHLEVAGPLTFEGPPQLTITPLSQLGFPSLSFLKGASMLNGSASGTLGIPDPSATPQALAGSATWTDVSGNLWLFGGDSGSGGLRGELWKYDGTNWTLVDGLYTDPSQVTIPSVRPGARFGAATWVIGTRLYLFGGMGNGYVSGLALGDLSDLWYYDTANNTWTFVSGPLSPFSGGTQGTLGVESPSNNPGSREGATAWINQAGEVFLFGGSNNGLLLNDLWQWNPTSGYWTWIGGNADSPSSDPDLPSPRAYAAHWYVAAENSLYLFGGSIDSGTGGSGELWQFNGASWTLKKGNDATDPGRVIIQDRSFDPLNNPGRIGGDLRTVAQSWMLPSGEMYMYQQGVLWAYDRFINQWAALLMDMQRYDLAYQAPVYSTMASPSYQNRMGLRQGGNVWVKGGQMFMMGGYSTDGGTFGMRNDLWEILAPHY